MSGARYRDPLKGNVISTATLCRIERIDAGFLAILFVFSGLDGRRHDPARQQTTFTRAVHDVLLEVFSGDAHGFLVA